MEQPEQQPDDEWTGSAKRPWVNPPMRYSLGSGGRAWRIALGVVVLTFVAVIVLLVLARQDVVSESWAYVALAVGLVSAFAARVLGVLKASSEDKRG
ncbi:hypothetical protein [Aeromicrobium terrae]|uniref:Uncharacterized protein n=1 Tax=Aeromicrobium terrae TaxID=2498846 RepID=A0A5C8NKC8_9ACTN|nr:hypothetical protein [Aeromicrobium terrae]TXL62304.1 hypothetical protein FHP06_06310 [Aeromicrobium terrae]